MAADDETKTAAKPKTEDIAVKYHLDVLKINDPFIPKLKYHLANYETEIDFKNVYYNIYNINDLKNALLSSEYVTKYNIIDDIINIICKYNGILDWTNDDKYKSNVINVINTNNNLISYAIVDTDNPSHVSRYDTIFLNQWFDINCNKKIFKYIFKVNKHYSTTNYPFCGPDTIIGIITNRMIKEQDLINKSNADNGKQDLSKHHYAVGEDECGNSFGWNVCSNICSFYFKNDYDDEGPGKDSKLTKWCKFGRIMKIDDIDSYFLLEINLIKKTMKIISTAFGSFDKIQETSIPETVLNAIKDEEMFTIAYSVNIIEPGHFAFGLVKINMQYKLSR